MGGVGKVWAMQAVARPQSSRWVRWAPWQGFEQRRAGITPFNRAICCAMQTTLGGTGGSKGRTRRLPRPVMAWPFCTHLAHISVPWQPVPTAWGRQLPE